MKKLLLTPLIALAIMTPYCSFAWGKMGHKMVVEIAYTMIDAHTRENVQKVLGGMGAEEAGNWMDHIKSDHFYDHMKPWHYVNVAEGKTYEETEEKNVINQLTRVVEELKHKDKMKEDDIRTNLLIIMHLVGDLHQPLHVGYLVDKGGNDIRVKYKGESTNLHRIWDSDIIEQEHITLSDCLQFKRSFDSDELAALTAINVANWMRQPRSQVKGCYAFSDGKIDEAYIAKNKRIIEQEIFLAGARLAAVLNECFK